MLHSRAFCASQGPSRTRMLHRHRARDAAPGLLRRWLGRPLAALVQPRSTRPRTANTQTVRASRPGILAATKTAHRRQAPTTRSVFAPRATFAPANRATRSHARLARSRTKRESRPVSQAIALSENTRHRRGLYRKPVLPAALEPMENSAKSSARNTRRQNSKCRSASPSSLCDPDLTTCHALI